MLSAKGQVKGTVAGFSLTEVLCALGTLGLVVALFMQGLGQIELGKRALEEKARLLAVKEALKRELIYHPPPLLGTRLLKEGPLVYLSFASKELGLKEGMVLSPHYTGGEALVVYASSLEPKGGAVCVKLDLCPLSLNGAMGESWYSFPFCL